MTQEQEKGEIELELEARLAGKTPQHCTHEVIGLPMCTTCDPRMVSEGGPRPEPSPAVERKPPFHWNNADKARLVPGATVVCSAGERCTYLCDDPYAYGYLRLHDVEHDIRFSEAREDVDPLTIEAPVVGFDANGSESS